MKLRLLRNPHKIVVATVPGGQEIFADCHDCGELEPVIYGILTTDDGFDPEYLCERCTKSRMPNPYLKPGSKPFAELANGTPLYPAYHPLRVNECYRRAMGLWTGATGERVAVTLDGQLYRQSQLWGGEGTRPDRWQRFKLRGA